MPARSLAEVDDAAVIAALRAAGGDKIPAVLISVATLADHAVLAASPRLETVYVLRNPDRYRQTEHRSRRIPSSAPKRAPGLLIDRAEEPRFYAEPQISRRRRRRLRGRLKGLARACS